MKPTADKYPIRYNLDGIKIALFFAFDFTARHILCHPPSGRYGFKTCNPKNLFLEIKIRVPMAKCAAHGKPSQTRQMTFPCLRRTCGHKKNKKVEHSLSLKKISLAENSGKGCERARLGTEMAIRRFCLECQGKMSLRVLKCSDISCPLYALRLGPERRTPVLSDLELGQPAKTHISDEHPARAIRRYCMTCCGGIRSEVRTCEARENCALWLFRHGVTPEKRKEVLLRLSSQKQLWLPGIYL